MTKGGRFFLFGFLFLLTTWLLHKQENIPLLWVWLGWAATAFVLCLFIFLKNTGLKTKIRSYCFAGCWGLMGVFLAFASGSSHIYTRLNQHLPVVEDNRIFRMQLQVIGLPLVRDRSVQFLAKVHAAKPNYVPKTILVRWFAPDWVEPYQKAKTPYAFPDIIPGQWWQVTAALRIPNSTQNRFGFDYEQYAFTQGIRAIATVRGSPIEISPDQFWVQDNSLNWLKQFAGKGSHSITSVYIHIQKWRYKLKKMLLPYLKEQPWGKVVLALALGDRSLFTNDDWQLFNRSGLTHLISISGTHITLVAGSVGWLILFGVRRLRFFGISLTQWYPAPVLAGFAAIFVAALYSALAGWGVPARRSFFMLSFAFLGYLGRLSISPSILLLLSAVVVLLLDPWAMLSTGFWLSFGAVTVLMACWSWSGQTMHPLARRGKFSYFVQFFLWQAIITVMLWPMLIWFFSEFSLASVITNLYAITLLGTLATPLSLLFVLSVYFFGDYVLTKTLLQLAFLAIHLALDPTQWLVQSNWAALKAAQAPWWVYMCTTAGLVVALWPRFWFGQRWFWFTVLPILFWPNRSLDTGEWAMDVLDVGQGLATVIRTKNHVFVYDTGRRVSPHQDEAQRILVPHLRGLGVRSIDAAIISHADLDHIGGLRTLAEHFPINMYMASFSMADWWTFESNRLGELWQPKQPDYKLRYCLQKRGWTVDGVRFQFIWPEIPLESFGQSSAERNAASCVLAIEGKHHRALIAGDISIQQEQQLLNYHLAPQYHVVVVPHHGSKYGSGAHFVQHMRACFAVASAGWWNRFSHPHPTVVQRWQDVNTMFLSTLYWGSQHFVSSAKGLQWHAQRDAYARYWHHPKSQLVRQKDIIHSHKAMQNCRQLE